MEFNIGPIDFRFYARDNWTHGEIAWVSNRNGGMAYRETAIRAGFKSDHLTDTVAKDNPADSFECPDTGTIFFGKILQAPTGTYVLSAKDVYTKAIYERACKQGLNNAQLATNNLQPVTTQS